MAKTSLKRPVQRAVPYAPKPTAPKDEAARQMAGFDAQTGDLTHLENTLNAGPSVQRLAALQRVANGAAPVQRAEEEELQGKFIQRMEEEELQGKFIQKMDEEELQGKFAGNPSGATVQAKSDGDSGGLPGDLKAGIENLSGMSMDGVTVHRNSSKPAAVQAHAYAQGSDIHLAPGQDQHLAHEAWHVVQQAEGRAKPTMQAKGVAINDDAGLEREADVMGAKAQALGSSLTSASEG